MEIPQHLLKKRNIVKLVLFTAAFALLFMNIYKPFDSKNWYEVSDFLFFLFSAPVILTGVLVVVISRIIMYHHSKRSKVSYLKYFLWVFVEILVMSLFYTIFIHSLKVNIEKDVMTTFKASMINTSLVLLLPYITLWFYFGWEESKQQLAQQESDQEQDKSPSNLLFTDDKGVLRLSIKFLDLLYIEANDNYVTIHYSAANKIKRFLLRTTLKRLEEELADTSVVRCHRSYLVNFDRVKSMRRESDSIYLELDSNETGPLPISKSYRNSVSQRFMASSPSNKVV